MIYDSLIVYNDSVFQLNSSTIFIQIRKLRIKKLQSGRGSYTVVSCPPPWELVPVMIATGLPESCCVLHSSLVESRKALNWAAIIPNIVGKPKIKPSGLRELIGVNDWYNTLGWCSQLSRLLSWQCFRYLLMCSMKSRRHILRKYGHNEGT